VNIICQEYNEVDDSIKAHIKWNILGWLNSTTTDYLSPSSLNSSVRYNTTVVPSPTLVAQSERGWTSKVIVSSYELIDEDQYDYERDQYIDDETEVYTTNGTESSLNLRMDRSYNIQVGDLIIADIVSIINEYMNK